MKRTFFLILLGATAMPTLLPAEMPPSENAPGVAAPNNPAAPPMTGPALEPSPNIQAQPNNVVENGAPRGPLGSLASGAPGVADKLPAPATAAPAVSAPVPGGTVAAGPAVATTQKTAIVEQRAVNKMPHEILVFEAMGHCFFDAMREAHKRDFAGPLMIGGGFPFPLPPAGDLKLISVQQMGGNPGEPPLYRVAFRNLSRFPAKHFRVSVIATHGRLNQNSPVVSAEVEELAADGIGQLDLRVPAAALTLGPASAPAAFDTLIVVLDSLNVLPETNEWNNVAEFGRTSITMVEVSQTAPAAAATPPATTGPAPNNPTTPAPTGPTTPQAAPMSPQPGPESGSDPAPSEEIDEAATLLSR